MSPDVEKLILLTLNATRGKKKGQNEVNQLNYGKCTQRYNFLHTYSYCTPKQHSIYNFAHRGHLRSFKVI